MSKLILNYTSFCLKFETQGLKAVLEAIFPSSYFCLFQPHLQMPDKFFYDPRAWTGSLKGFLSYSFQVWRSSELNSLRGVLWGFSGCFLFPCSSIVFNKDGTSTDLTLCKPSLFLLRQFQIWKKKPKLTSSKLPLHPDPRR